MLLPMADAPHMRPVTLRAVQLIPGLGPVNERPFDVIARFYPEHDYWAAEDKPDNGLPSMGLIPLHPLGYIC